MWRSRSLTWLSQGSSHVWGLGCAQAAGGRGPLWSSSAHQLCRFLGFCPASAFKARTDRSSSPRMSSLRHRGLCLHLPHVIIALCLLTTVHEMLPCQRPASQQPESITTFISACQGLRTPGESWLSWHQELSPISRGQSSGGRQTSSLSSSACHFPFP